MGKNMEPRKGFVEVYTGEGKGKTTAALGLALRAAGAGHRVFIGQFAKGIETGEIKILKKLGKNITIKQFGARRFIKKHGTAVDVTLARNGIAVAEKALMGGRFDLVILDELCVACDYNLVPVPAILDMLKKRPAHVEVVITGRNAPKALINAADLVTEMKEIRHYYKNGVKARKGIEY